MHVRRVKEDELRQALMIARVCFHTKTEDIEKVEPDESDREADQWGAFLSDETMAARMQNNHYVCNLDGHAVSNGGIGGVSTLPEYRNSGAVREIFRALLPDARKKGEVISTLYPFSHSFYRKFGYETVVHQNIYEMKPEVLKDYRFDGKAVLYRPGDPAEEFSDIYRDFTQSRNLSLQRTEDYMKREWLNDDPYKTRCFSYLLYTDGRPEAYMIFQDVYHNPQAILKVEEAAFRSRRGFLAILGFLSRFSADYGTVQLPLPTDIDLLSLLHSDQSYSVKKSAKQDYMIRVVNVQKLLSVLSVPEGACFVISVNDDLIPENCGTFRVTGKTQENIVEAAGDSPDLSLSVRALGQAACGAIGFSELLLREDATINGNCEVLAQVFRRKAIYIMDHF